jgi:hypothetical protein
MNLVVFADSSILDLTLKHTLQNYSFAFGKI